LLFVGGLLLLTPILGIASFVTAIISLRSIIKRKTDGLILTIFAIIFSLIILFMILGALSGEPETPFL
jgi:hypothetical protein|tara:strand:- start:590 stop:793 length:204 start_codon:yes stop_codon:yes gene_type:complete